MNVNTATAPAPNPNYPLFSGLPFLYWLTDTAERINAQSHTKFYGAAAVHRSYDRGGIPAARGRCVEGIVAAANLVASDRIEADADFHAAFVFGWIEMLTALNELAWNAR